MTKIVQFNFAQTFFIDPGVVKNAAMISISGLGVFFKTKPSATKNTSGIINPGVTFYLVDTKISGTKEVPDLEKPIDGAVGRLEYSDIITSSNASTETKVRLQFPVTIKTGRSYGIVCKYDGNEQFAMWTSTQGHLLAGSSSKTSGPAGSYIGNFFEFTESTGDTVTWRESSTVDLKFNVYCAEYQFDSYANTTSVTANGATVNSTVGLRSFLLYKENYEFILYDGVKSTNTANVIGGELIYQQNVSQPDTVSVLAGKDIISTQNANFTSIYGNSNTEQKFIVIESGAQKNIRRVVEISSDKVIRVDSPLTFSNNVATFSKVVGGVVDLASKTIAFGRYSDQLVITQSNANSSLRFVDYPVQSVSKVASGTGYSNTDYLAISGGDTLATANIVTNSTGGIVNTRLTSIGSGFTKTPIFTVYNANNTLSVGTDATFTATIGSILKTEQSNATFVDTTVVNAPVSSVFIAAADIENPPGTTVAFKNHYAYSSVTSGLADIIIVQPGSGYVNGAFVTFANTSGTGAVGVIQTDSVGKIVDIVMKDGGNNYNIGTTVSAPTGTAAVLSPVIGIHKKSTIPLGNQQDINLHSKSDVLTSNSVVIASRSYEVMQPNVVITTATNKTVNTNVSSVIEMIISSNNAYSAADVTSGEVKVFYGRNIINNTTKDEHIGNGKAIAKHISDTINFGNDRIAEDIRVFVDAYRPQGTEIHLYARVHNNNDPEAFSQKDWTKLELKSKNASIYSAVGNSSDLIEFEYGFYSAPNFGGVIKLNGSVSTALSSAVVTGVDTNFTANLAVNDLVKIYSPLFPTNYIIDTVTSIANTTSFTLNNIVSNNNVVGTGLVIEKMEYKNQAFNYGLNDNTVRYYNHEMSQFDGYSSVAIKVVFTSNNDFIIPKAAVTKVIGVTA